MGEVDIDLTNYRDKMGERVAPGRYRVLVEDTQNDKSKAQNPMINVWYRVLNPGPYQNATIVDRLVLTEKSMFRVVGFMQAIGLPTPKKKLRIDPDRQFRGKVLEIDVEDGEPYLGKVKSEVRGYLPASAQHESAPDLDESAIAAGVAEHATADNPGVGGLAEFAPGGAADQWMAKEVAQAPIEDPQSRSPQAGNGHATPGPALVSVPDDIDIDELNL